MSIIGGRRVPSPASNASGRSFRGGAGAALQPGDRNDQSGSGQLLAQFLKHDSLARFPNGENVRRAFPDPA